MLYRLWTEDTNRAGITLVCDLALDSYTLFTADGVWKGTHEKALCIEVETGCKPDLLLQLARTIKNMNGQDAVLVQMIPCDSITV